MWREVDDGKTATEERGIGGMNLHLVDEIQRLADCRSHAERADWLLSVPITVLQKYEWTICSRLTNADFAIGAHYVVATNQILRAPRIYGLWNRDLSQVIRDITDRMKEAAKPKPAPDPAPSSPTDL
jgi:hypothetical protein